MSRDGKTLLYQLPNAPGIFLSGHLILSILLDPLHVIIASVIVISHGRCPLSKSSSAELPASAPCTQHESSTVQFKGLVSKCMR